MRTRFSWSSLMRSSVSEVGLAARAWGVSGAGFCGFGGGAARSAGCFGSGSGGRWLMGFGGGRCEAGRGAVATGRLAGRGGPLGAGRGGTAEAAFGGVTALAASGEL